MLICECVYLCVCVCIHVCVCDLLKQRKFVNMITQLTFYVTYITHCITTCYDTLYKWTLSFKAATLNDHNDFSYVADLHLPLFLWENCSKIFSNGFISRINFCLNNTDEKSFLLQSDYTLT